MFGIDATLLAPMSHFGVRMSHIAGVSICLCSLVFAVVCWYLPYEEDITARSGQQRKNDVSALI